MYEICIDFRCNFYYCFRMAKSDFSKLKVLESNQRTSVEKCRQPKTGRERTRPRPQPQENVQQPTLTTGEKIRQWLNTLFRCVSAIVDVVELVMEHC